MRAWHKRVASGHTSNFAYTVPNFGIIESAAAVINFIDPSGLQSCETQTSRASLCKTGQGYSCEVERLAVWPMERELVTCWLILGWHTRHSVGSCCWHLCTICQHREGKTRAISVGIFGPIKGHWQQYLPEICRCPSTEQPRRCGAGEAQDCYRLCQA